MIAWYTFRIHRGCGANVCFTLGFQIASLIFQLRMCWRIEYSEVGSRLCNLVICLPAAGPGTPTIAGYLISARAVPGTLCRQYLCPSCHITAPSLADKMVTYKNSFIINVPS